MKTRKLLITLLIAIGITGQTSALPGDEGMNIFKNRCGACHKIDQDFAGPALANVHQRRSIDWIIKFVHSPQAMIKSGDTSATALFAKFNGLVMPDHADLSDDNIRSIVDYIKAESANVTAAPETPFEKPGELQPSYTPLGANDLGFFLSYGVVIATLILVLLFAVHVKELERKMQGQG